MKTYLEYLFLFPLRILIYILPFRAVQHLGSFLGTFIYYIIPVRKKLVMQNLRYAYPEKSNKELSTIALQNFKNVYTTFLELFWIPRMSGERLRQLVTIPELEKINEQLKNGKGTILLSGHYGNWELCAIAFGYLSNHKLLAVVKKQHNKFIDRFMNSIRTQFTNTVVDMDEAPRGVLKHLRENGAIAIVADQSGPEEGLFINFFGRPTSTHVGPAVFSVRTSAPILMAFFVRNSDGTFTILTEQLDMTNLFGSTEDKIRTLTERHVQMLEKYVRLHPEHWLWMHKRWKHTEKYLQRQREAVNQ